jgi:hypothetical protein
MANTTKRSTAGPDQRADAALAWLAGQLRWERTLERLHRAAAGEPEVEPSAVRRDQAA